MRGPGKDIMGLPGLAPREALKVATANKQAFWAGRLFGWASAGRIPCIIENPALSRVWDSPPLARVAPKARTVVFHMCAFGTAWRKATKLMYCGCDLQDLERFQCQVSGGVCAYSGNPHTVLSGRIPGSSRFYSELAAVYPKKLCAAVSTRILHRRGQIR